MTARNLIGLVYNQQVTEAAGFVATLAESLNLHDRCWTSSAADLTHVRDKLENTSRIAVVGGDGTILRTVRVVAPFSIPMVGINMGRVGFLTELSVAEAAAKLPAYLSGSPRVEERMMLQASVTSDSQDTPHITLHGLNDMVVGRGEAARLLDIDATVDTVPLTSYRADAVIVSTATGSTGYALSAGGPILHPELQVILVQPVAAHTGLRDGLILPGDSAIELKIRGDRPAMLSADGSSHTVLTARDKVSISRSPHAALFLRARPPTTFYTALMDRLGLVYRWKPPHQDA